MEISRKQWHTRVYLWWYNNKYNPYELKHNLSIQKKVHTNLCPYVRAVLFWAPLNAILNDWIEIPIKSLKLPICFFTIPTLLTVAAMLFSLIGPEVAFFSWFLLVTVDSSAALMTVIVILTRWFENRRKSAFLALKATEQSNFRKLITDYLRSGHDRICPEIDIKD